MMPAATPPTYAPGKHASGLRIVTHNVQGLAKLKDLLYLWHAERYHVLLLQETKTADTAAVSARLAALSEQLGLSRYTMFWGPNTSTPRSAGVAIFIRQDLITSNRMQVHADKLLCHPSGRQMLLPVRWQGHQLTLINLYLPSGDYPAQRLHLSTILQPALEAVAVRSAVILAGDFNHTFDVARDRYTAAGPAEPGDHRPEVAASQAMLTLCHTHHLQDAFRHRHPTSRAFTHKYPGGVSLLDHVMVSDCLLPFVMQCHIHPAFLTDHKPVVLHLQPKDPAPAPAGPRLPRLRIKFQPDPALVQAFQVWARAQLALAPPAADPPAFLAWWPQFKLDLSAKLHSLNHQFEQHRHQQQQPTAACRAALQALRAALDVYSQAQADVYPALQACLQAQEVYQHALAHSGLTDEQRARFAWLPLNEQGGALMAHTMNPPASAHQVAALQAQRGRPHHRPLPHCHSCS